VDKPALSSKTKNDPMTQLAAERTFLAWVRTSLALMGFGFVVARFGLFLREVTVLQNKMAPRPGYSPAFGIAIVALGVVVIAVAAIRYQRLLERLENGDPFRPARKLSLWLSIVLGVIGLAMTVYLVATSL
jgi:putative membrane protein